MIRQDKVAGHEEANRYQETGLDGSNEMSPRITEKVGDPSNLDGLLRRMKSPELAPATIAPHPSNDLKDLRERGDYKIAMLEDAARSTSYDQRGRRVDRATQVKNYQSHRNNVIIGSCDYCYYYMMGSHTRCFILSKKKREDKTTYLHGCFLRLTVQSPSW